MILLPLPPARRPKSSKPNGINYSSYDGNEKNQDEKRQLQQKQIVKPTQNQQQQRSRSRRHKQMGVATTFLFATVCSICLPWYHTFVLIENESSYNNDWEETSTQAILPLEMMLLSSSYNNNNRHHNNHNKSQTKTRDKAAADDDDDHSNNEKNNSEDMENTKSHVEKEDQGDKLESDKDLEKVNMHDDREGNSDGKKEPGKDEVVEIVNNHDGGQDEQNSIEEGDDGGDKEGENKTYDFTKPNQPHEEINFHRGGTMPPKLRTYRRPRRLLEHFEEEEGSTLSSKPRQDNPRILKSMASFRNHNNNTNNTMNYSIIRNISTTSTIYTKTNQISPPCTKWGVVVVTSSQSVSSIVTASESIRRVASYNDWCVVIVTDNHKKGFNNNKNKNKNDTPPSIPSSLSTSWYTPLIETGSVFVFSSSNQKQQEQDWVASSTGTAIPSLSKNETAIKTHKNASVTFTPKVGEFLQLLRSKLLNQEHGNNNTVSSSYAIRKNTGYLYAISRGAQYLFDFDPDIFIDTTAPTMTTMTSNSTTSNNMPFTQTKNNNTASHYLPPLLPNDKYIKNVGVVLIGQRPFNPYPLMEASGKESVFPRGFPVSSRDNYWETSGSLPFARQSVDLSKVSVISYCVNVPNINTFDPQGWPVIVPPHTFVPYTSSATIHTPRSLWALLLPTTVPRGVSDIWRAYISEALFRELDLRSVISSSPGITLQKTVPIDDGDIHRQTEETTLNEEALDEQYFDEPTELLLNYLNQWTSPSDSVPVRMEQLWIDLYERGYIEEVDVHLVQLWWESLFELGYYNTVYERRDFKKMNKINPTVPIPQVTGHRRHFNVALMGQFNYQLSLDRVLFWHQKWREVFHHVVARGPFNKRFLQQLHDHGLEAYRAIRDKGYTSLVQNYRRTLLQFEHEPGVEGILHLHDDAMMNMRVLTGGRRNETTLQRFPFPTRDIIVNNLPHRWFYVDPRTIRDRDIASQLAWKIYPNGTYKKFNDETFTGWKSNRRLFEPWPWYGRCFPGHERVAADPASEKYREPDGSFLFSGHALADFMFLPMKYVRQVDELAELFLGKPEVFHECATPTIVDKLRHFHNATVRVVPLCTNGRIRNTQQMVLDCLDSKYDYAVMHPFKLSQGFAYWDATFDALVRR